jgi:hypothetical protein
LITDEFVDVSAVRLNDLRLHLEQGVEVRYHLFRRIPFGIGGETPDIGEEYGRTVFPLSWPNLIDSIVPDDTNRSARTVRIPFRHGVTVRASGLFHRRY